MQRRSARDFPQPVIDLYTDYAHGMMSRREFLDRASRYAVGGVTATVMLEALGPNFAWAQQVSRNDPRLKAEYVTFPSLKGSGTMTGYLVRPANASGRLPGVLVIHENRGLNPHIEDVARRFALEGYVVCAPEALSPLGGYPDDEDKAREMFAKLDPDKRTEDLLAGADFLKSHAECTGRIGAVGFCFGGGIVNLVAVRVPDLAAAVPFYGIQPRPEEAARIRAPLLIHYAGLDQRVNAGWPAYEAALKANGVRHTMYMYDGVNHAFFNDATPRYDDAAAKLAWARTIAFLKQHLKD